eukprot:COSAG05_NODE_292_length_12012_cov_12.968354_16_plen_66_part_00
MVAAPTHVYHTTHIRTDSGPLDLPVSETLVDGSGGGGRKEGREDIGSANRISDVPKVGINSCEGF